PRDPHPFPTRRSSDLRIRHLRGAVAAGARLVPAHVLHAAPGVCPALRVLDGEGERELGAPHGALDLLDRVAGDDRGAPAKPEVRSEEHTSELQSRENL